MAGKLLRPGMHEEGQGHAPDVELCVAALQQGAAEALEGFLAEVAEVMGLQAMDFGAVPCFTRALDFLESQHVGQV